MTSRVIARERLYFVSLVAFGLLFSTLAYFPRSTEYLQARRIVYDALTDQFRASKRLELQSQMASQWTRTDIPPPPPPKAAVLSIDTLRPFGTFEQFSGTLDDDALRRRFYDTVSTKYRLGDINSFERKVLPPSQFTRVEKLLQHLFSRSFWFSTWLAVLVPYLLVLFVRSVIWSLKTLRTKA